MDETVPAIIEKITVTFDKPTQLPGGHFCEKFFDCSRLSPNDLARLAAQAVGDLSEDAFEAVIGIAYSGILFAAAVAGGKQVNIFQKDGEVFGSDLTGKRVLIVDDVVATGNHLAVAEKKVTQSGGVVVGYACVVDRSSGKIGSKSKPLYSAIQAAL